MAVHSVSFNIPTRELGKADVVFLVKKDNSKLGELHVSNGRCQARRMIPARRSAVAPSQDRPDRDRTAPCPVISAGIAPPAGGRSMEPRIGLDAIDRIEHNPHRSWSDSPSRTTRVDRRFRAHRD
jgi:hypothetical protein